MSKSLESFLAQCANAGQSKTAATILAYINKPGAYLRTEGDLEDEDKKNAFIEYPSDNTDCDWDDIDSCRKYRLNAADWLNLVWELDEDDDDEDEEESSADTDSAVEIAFPKLSQDSKNLIVEWYDNEGASEDFSNDEDFAEFMKEDLVDMLYASCYSDEAEMKLQQDLVDCGYFDLEDTPGLYDEDEEEDEDLDEKIDFLRTKKSKVDEAVENNEDDSCVDFETIVDNASCGDYDVVAAIDTTVFVVQDSSHYSDEELEEFEDISWYDYIDNMLQSLPEGANVNMRDPTAEEIEKYYSDYDSDDDVFVVFELKMKVNEDAERDLQETLSKQDALLKEQLASVIEDNNRLYRRWRRI